MRRSALSALVVLAACASIISGRTQTVRFTTTPSDVEVTVEPGGLRVVTPGELVLSRKQAPYRLHFEKPGYKPLDLSLRAEMNGWVWGNVLLGGVIGIAIDFATGAANALTPDQVHADLAALHSRLQEPSTGDLLVFDREGALLLALLLEP